MLLGRYEYADLRTDIDLREVCFYFDRGFPIGATIEAANGQLHQASSTNLAHHSHVDKLDQWAPKSLINRLFNTAIRRVIEAGCATRQG